MTGLLSDFHPHHSQSSLWALLFFTSFLFSNLSIYLFVFGGHQSDCFVSIPAFIYAGLKVANIYDIDLGV